MDLTAVARRLRTRELLEAIVDPSKDIAPAFAPTAIVTTSGKIYNGMMIYQSQEMTLLQISHEGLRHGMLLAYLERGEDWWR